MLHGIGTIILSETNGNCIGADTCSAKSYPLVLTSSHTEFTTTKNPGSPGSM